MSIIERIGVLQGELELFDEPLQKYEYIIELGHDLPPLEEAYRSELYRVQGCQSTVWLHPFEKEGKLYFEADADALIVRGLVQILIRIFSGATAQEIVSTDRKLLERLGLSEIITAGRQNGVASMLGRIYGFAQERIDG
jgi:cysteine desulfuration protein SufE